MQLVLVAVVLLVVNMSLSMILLSITMVLLLKQKAEFGQLSATEWLGCLVCAGRIDRCLRFGKW